MLIGRGSRVWRGARLWGKGIWLACALAASCRTALLLGDPVNGPVQVRAISASFAGDLRADFTVRFAVKSPRGGPGTVSRLDWELWLQGRWFASGRQELAQPIAAAGTSEFEVTLPLVFRRPPESDEQLELPAGIRGFLYVSRDHSEDALPFEKILLVRAKPVFSSTGAE